MLIWTISHEIVRFRPRPTQRTHRIIEVCLHCANTKYQFAIFQNVIKLKKTKQKHLKLFKNVQYITLRAICYSIES